MHLVAVLLELLVDRLQLGGSSRGSSGTALDVGHLALVEGLLLDNTLGLQLVDRLLVLPADLARDALQCSVLTTRLETQHTQRIRNNKLLLAVVWRRHALIDLEALKRGRATGGLVRHHTTDRAEENARRSTVVEWTALAWVDKVALVHKLKVLQLSTC